MFIKSLLLLILISGVFACSPDENPEQFLIPRRDKIPDDVQKMNPSPNLYPPILHSSDFEEPIPINHYTSKLKLHPLSII
jgi:hypothetical protein